MVTEVVVAPSYAQATAWNRECSRKYSAGLFGSVAQDFGTWVEKLWEQNGDGRRLASPLAARIVAHDALARRESKNLANTPGLVGALVECARNGFGVPGFDAAIAQVQAGEAPNPDTPTRTCGAFTPAEWEFLHCIAEYASGLERCGLIELGQALSVLASRGNDVFSRPVKVRFLGDAPLTAQQEAFFARLEHVDLMHDPDVSPGKLARTTAAKLRFAFPAGRYAQPSVVMQAIRDALSLSEQASVVVACSDPLALYDRIAPALSKESVTCAAQGSLRFTQTDLGRVLEALRRARLEDVPWDKDSLTTVLHSALLGEGKGRVWKEDAILRKDRIIGRDDAFERLCPTSEDESTLGQSMPLEALQALMSNPLDESTYARLDAEIAKLRRRGFSKAYVQEQRSALGTMRETAHEMRCLGCDERSMFESVMAQATMSSSRANYEQRPGEAPSVLFTTQKRASQLAPSSVSALIACDLTMADYPLSSKRTAVESLLERLGAGRRDTPLAQARRMFSSLVQAPSELLVLERSLNDANADPLYPCAMWEEFVDAYREGDLSDRSDLDRTYRLPERLRADRYEKGEECLLADMRPGFERSDFELVPSGRWEREDAGRMARCVGRASSPADEDDGLMRLSASQIETYLECPYQWLVSRRLRATELDESFGPDTFGTLFHEVFHDFYSAFGHKVIPENLSGAQQLMFGDDCVSGIFSKVVAHQYEKKPGNRLVPIPATTEEAEIARLKARIANWLAFEAGFLPRFTPIAFECEIRDFEYEGALINGSIDRIDLNDKGEAVIIDYKGSLKTAHQAFRRKGRKKDSPGAFQDDGKVQLALYADITRRAGSVWQGRMTDESGIARIRFGLGAVPPEVERIAEYPISKVVGCLYASYNAGNHVLGAYDVAAVSGAADIPTLKSKGLCGLPADNFENTFDDYLEFNRLRAAKAIEGIRAGRVEVNPTGKEACRYCPVLTCEKRSDDEAY